MKIAIVEDNALLSENLRQLLGGEAGMTVVGAFGTAEEALGCLNECRPDVLLADLGLPGMSGIELIKAAKDRLPDLDIMAYTVFEDSWTVLAALEAGATGCILKGCTSRELIEALRCLQQGGALMSSRIARAMMKEFQGRDDVGEDTRLSQSERDILRHLEEGLTCKEVAEQACTSPLAVHARIKNIYDKLRIRNRREAPAQDRERETR